MLIIIQLNETARGNLGTIKKALMEAVGIVSDPLTAGQAFMNQHQSAGETVRDYAADIEKLFKESYPEDAQSSPILLQRFLTGLVAPICCQLLLKDKPTTIEQAITSIEYALKFEPVSEQPSEINAIHKSSLPPDNSDSRKLHALVESMTKKMTELEAKLDSATKTQQQYSVRQWQPNADYPRTCWQCGEPGHVHHYCPLNGDRPVRSIGGWPMP